MSTETPAPIWRASLTRMTVTEPSPTGWFNTTTQELAALVERARAHKMTPAERKAQRISFVCGQTGLPKAQIEAVLYGEPS